MRLGYMHTGFNTTSCIWGHYCNTVQNYPSIQFGRIVKGQISPIMSLIQRREGEEYSLKDNDAKDILKVRAASLSLSSIKIPDESRFDGNMTGLVCSLIN